MRKIVALCGALVLVWWTYSWLSGKQNDRSYLLGLPSQVASLAEKRKVGDIKKLISENYSDSSGRTYAEVVRILAAHALAGGDVSIFILGPKVELDAGEKHAKLSFRAAMARGPKNPGALDIIPDSASYWGFNLDLEKGSGGWLVVTGDWTPER
jgi:hypothetical protein